MAFTVFFLTRHSPHVVSMGDVNPIDKDNLSHYKVEHSINQLSAQLNREEKYAFVK